MLFCPRYLAVLYLDISELVFEWLKCLQHLRENVLRCFKCVLNFRKREPSYTDSVLLVAKNILILCHVYALPVLSNIKEPIRNRILLRFLDITTVIHNICFLNVLIEKANHFDFIKTMGIGSIYKIKSVSFFLDISLLSWWLWVRCSKTQYRVAVFFKRRKYFFFFFNM